MVTSLRLLDALIGLDYLLAEDLDSFLRRENLGRTQVRLLWSVYEGGPCSQRRIAEALGLSARAVSGLIDTLEQSGFVIRQDDPNDRRAHVISLSAHSSELCDRMQADREELASSLLSALPARDASVVITGLEAITERLAELIAAQDAES